MDRLREFLETVRTQGTAKGQLLGLLNVLIGRRLALEDGPPVSGGLPWREVARLLRQVRWEPSAVADLGLDPAALPARDRQRYWYSAISRANVGSEEATAAGDRLA